MKFEMLCLIRERSRRNTFKLVSVFCLVFFGGCGLLVNNNTDCQTARDTAKKFYSIHFDRELSFSKAKVQSVKQFLTPELNDLLSKNAEREEATQVYSTKYRDPLTLSVEPPRAFRIGECRIENDSSRANVETSILWKVGDEQATERRIHLLLRRENGEWRIENVTEGAVGLQNIFEEK